MEAPMSRSNRGAARVSAVWLISVGVIAFAALAFGFISQSDLAAQRDRAEDADAATADAVAAADELREIKRNLSTHLGWYDRTDVDPLADQTALVRAQTGNVAFVPLVLVLVASAMAVSAIGSGITLRRFLRV